MKYFIFIALSVLFSSGAFAEDVQPSTEVEILEVLENYSKRTDVKFVTDPRIRGKVSMIGLKLDEIDKTDLNKILLIHNMVAYENSDVVYVIPVQIEDEKGEQLGVKWETSD